MRMIAAGAAVYGIGLALAMSAQEPAAPKPTFRAGIDVVQVDVSVLDKQRQPVRGLTASDFTLLEDGTPRPVVAFSAVELPEAAAARAAAPWVGEVARDVTTNDLRPEGRLVVIVFDWSIRFEDQALARRIAASAVDQLGPGDLAAVIFSSSFGNAGTSQNFTSDRARLLAAIGRPFAAAMHNPPKGSPFHDPRNNNEVMIDDPEGYESGDCYCRMCGPETIARVADAVRDVRGRRKTLLFIGTYVRLYESLQGPTTRLGPEFKPGLGGRPVVHPGVCGAYLKDARAKMERATSLANLTIHTIDAVGMETDGNSPMGGSIIGQQDRRADLGALADTTGGRTVMNTNAPEALMPALFAESHSYYLLAFSPANLNRKGKFHKIEVKVNRPGITVRTRAGYYTGETDAKRIAPTLLSPKTTAALEGVLPRPDIPLGVVVAPFALPGKDASEVGVVLSVQQSSPAEALPKEPVKVVVAAFDSRGRPVQSETQTIAVTSRSTAPGNASYEVVSRLTLEPGRYEVRAALDDGSRQGSVYTYVNVPDFRKQPLALSAIAIAASPARPSAPPDAFTNLLPIVPTAQREFQRSHQVISFARVYQRVGQIAQPVTVVSRIVDTEGRTVFGEARDLPSDRFGTTHAADYRLELPIGRLSAGEYLLTIDAASGTNTAGRGVRFSIR